MYTSLPDNVDTSRPLYAGIRASAVLASENDTADARAVRAAFPLHCASYARSPYKRPLMSSIYIHHLNLISTVSRRFILVDGGTEASVIVLYSEYRYSLVLY